jgi:hypothetical protein
VDLITVFGIERNNFSPTNLHTCTKVLIEAFSQSDCSVRSHGANDFGVLRLVPRGVTNNRRVGISVIARIRNIGILDLKWKPHNRIAFLIIGSPLCKRQRESNKNG